MEAELHLYEWSYLSSDHHMNVHNTHTHVYSPQHIHAHTCIHTWRQKRKKHITVFFCLLILLGGLYIHLRASSVSDMCSTMVVWLQPQLTSFCLLVFYVCIWFQPPNQVLVVSFTAGWILLRKWPSLLDNLHRPPAWTTLPSLYWNPFFLVLLVGAVCTVIIFLLVLWSWSPSDFWRKCTPTVRFVRSWNPLFCSGKTMFRYTISGWA